MPDLGIISKSSYIQDTSRNHCDVVHHPRQNEESTNQTRSRANEQDDDGRRIENGDQDPPGIHDPRSIRRRLDQRSARHKRSHEDVYDGRRRSSSRDTRSNIIRRSNEVDDVERNRALPDFFHLIGKVGSVRHHRGWLSRGFLRRFRFLSRPGWPHGQTRLERQDERVRDDHEGDDQIVARRDPFVKEDDRGHTEHHSHPDDDAPVRPQRPDAGASSNEPDESLANLTSRMPPIMSNASWAEVRPFRCDPVTTERAEVRNEMALRG